MDESETAADTIIVENLDHLQDEYTIVQENYHRTSSTVWRYFGSLKKNDVIIDRNHVYCSQCFDQRKTKKYQRSTSTGNLLKHLKKAHHIIVDQPLFRVKREKDGNLSMAKTEPQFDDGTCSQIIKEQMDDSENEYLVDDINEVLINEIQKRPQIYDASLCPKNKNQIRRELWVEIYHVMNQLIPLEKLPKIWKNIRDRYHKIKKDITRGSKTKPKYRYFESLSFLDNHYNSSIKSEDKSFSGTANYITETLDDEIDNLELHMDMSEYVNVKPRKAFVNTMKEVKLESFSSMEQEEMPAKRRKLCETENDESEQHLDEDDEHYGQPTNDSDFMSEQIIDEMPDDKQSDPLVGDAIKLQSTLTGDGNDVNDDDDDDGGDNHYEEPVIHIMETSKISPTLPTPSSSTLTTVSTLPKMSKFKFNSNHPHPNHVQLSQNYPHSLPTSAPLSASTPSKSSIILRSKTATRSATTSAAAAAATSSLSPQPNKSDEFDIFGNFVGQVMKEMSKSKARLLQMKILQLITEYDA